LYDDNPDSNFLKYYVVLLAGLSDAQDEEITGGFLVRVFHAGEVLVHAGDECTSSESCWKERSSHRRRMTKETPSLR
jgi:hypothetical protein